MPPMPPPECLQIKDKEEQIKTRQALLAGDIKLKMEKLSSILVGVCASRGRGIHGEQCCKQASNERGQASSLCFKGL